MGEARAGTLLEKATIFKQIRSRVRRQSRHFLKPDIILWKTGNMKSFLLVSLKGNLLNEEFDSHNSLLQATTGGCQRPPSMASL